MEGRREKRKDAGTGCLTAVLIFLILCLVLLLLAFFVFKNDNIIVQEEGGSTQESVPYQQVEEVQEEKERFYYGQLSEKEQMVYLEILYGIRENQKEIYVHSGDAEKTNLLFRYVLRDCPEIFWCDGTTTATTYDGDENYTVLEPVYRYDMSERRQRQEEIDAEVESCLSGIDRTSSDYEKILYVYEYIVNTVEYDLEAEDNQNIVSVFVNKRSVCAGYSKAAQYLLEKLGVFCTYITGVTEGGQSHAWNLVICERDYYYVDVTWGDPVFMEREGEETEQAGKDYISYDYMCCDEEELFRTHTPDEDIELPACTSMDYNYYVVNGMYYEYYDSQKALKAMNDVISEKGRSVVLKYADGDVYAQAHEDIFENVIHRAAQNLAKWYGLPQVKYSYIDNDRLNKIEIFWEYDE